MMFPLFAVLGTDVIPLLAEKDSCTGYRKYWNETAGACVDTCESGFYEDGEKVNVCITCDKDTQFATKETSGSLRECLDACEGKGYRDIDVGGVEYR